MKKKFTMLLVALLACVGVMAQTAATYADGVYKIYWQPDERGYLVYHAADYPNDPQLAGVVNHNPNGHYAADAEGLSFGWYLYTSAKTSKSYLIESTTGKFITIDLSTAVGNGKKCVLSESVSANAQFNLLEGSDSYTGQYLLRYTDGSTNYHFCSGCGANKGNNPVRFSTDGQGDGGNRFVFVSEGVSITDDVKDAAIAKIEAFEAIVDYTPTYTGTRTQQTRQISQISLTSSLSEKNPANVTTLTHEGNGAQYIDLTQTVVMQAIAGEEVTPAITMVSGSKWIHCYTYVDADADGFVSGDAVSFSYLNGVDSEGTTQADGPNTETMPSFTAPGTVGTYRMRFKTDWDSDEPVGGSQFASAWGTIVDVTLQVVAENTPEIEFTYKYKLDGVVVGEETFTMLEGSTYPTATLPYGVTATFPEGEIAAGEIDVNCTVDLPFEISSDYENATWYFMQIRGSKYVAKGETAPYENSTTLNATDAGLWAFTGDPFSGIQILNKAAGANYTLGFDGTPASETDIYMVENGDKTWNVVAGNGGFVLRYGDAANNYYAHDFNSKLQFWCDGNALTDNGSAFTLITEKGVVDDWKQLQLAALDYVGGYPSSLSNAINEITTVAGMSQFETENTKIAMQEGYYRIQNLYRETDGVKHMIGIKNGERKGAKGNMSDVNFIWNFVTCDDGYKIQAVNLGDNGYMNAIGTNTFADATNGAKFSLNELGSGQWSIKDGDGATMFLTNGGENLINWSGAAVNGDGAWYIIPATTVEYTLSDIDGEGYASAYLPFDVTLDEGVTAYAIESTNSTHAILAEKEDIKANQGAILIGTSGAHTFNIAAASSDWTNNTLVGTTVDTYLATDAYVLANGGKGVGLYKAALNKGEAGAEGTTHFLNNANKAYLPATGAEAPAMFSFGRGGDDAEDTTGIEQLAGDNAEVVIYDLAGRRVEKMEKGIYIVNGKKVIK